MPTTTEARPTTKFAVEFCGKLVSNKSGLIYLPSSDRAHDWLEKSGLDAQFCRVVSIITKSPLNELWNGPETTAAPVKPAFNTTRVEETCNVRTQRRHEENGTTVTVKKHGPQGNRSVRLKRGALVGYTVMMLNDDFSAFAKTVFAKSIDEATELAMAKYEPAYITAVIDMQIPPKRIHIIGD